MAAHDPIKIGSGLSDLVPQPGWEITTNEFGTDVCELEYHLSSQSTALSLRPARGDAYAGTSAIPLSGFYVDDAKVRGEEGTTATLRVLYKKRNTSRSPVIEADTDRKVSNNIIAGVPSALSVFGSVGFPEPVVTSRYCSSSAPNFASLMGAVKSTADAVAAGFPTLADITSKFHIGSSGFLDANGDPIAIGTTYEILWKASPFWTNTKLGYTPICAGQFYEVQENWRNTYYYNGFRLVPQ